MRFTATPSSLEVTVDFFTETFNLTLPAGFKPPAASKKWSAPDLYHCFRTLEQTDFEPYLQQLTTLHHHKELSDWLFFLLVDATHRKAFPKATPVQRDILNWFVLTKTGYDARLAYFDKSVYLYLRTQSMLYEVPFLEEDGKRFVNVSAIAHPGFENTQFYWPVFIENADPLDFSFSIKHWPQLKARPLTRTWEFSFRDSTIRWSGQINGLIAEVMAAHPLLEEAAYIEAPASKLMQETLLEEILQQLRGMPFKQQIQLLASFTRSAFSYAEDIRQFGTNKPMVAEETLLYPASDCEDRVALFYQIAHKLIAEPIIIVGYPDHVTIGIASEAIGGEYITHEGTKYYICDPTGPENNWEIGKIPYPYAGKKFEVIHVRKYKT